MKKIYLLLLAAITMVSCSVERHPEYMMDEDAMIKEYRREFSGTTERDAMDT